MNATFQYALRQAAYFAKVGKLGQADYVLQCIATDYAQHSTILQKDCDYYLAGTGYRAITGPNRLFEFLHVPTGIKITRNSSIRLLSGEPKPQFERGGCLLGRGCRGR
ncbi:hypothetical protein [Ensifer aridi]|uniref:hypothetical protein n=1 Tax=Ensifer aridi TaxID=1708715 RepID=UPI00111BE38A|nr:hypothetical protein [Ensifer aridi]